MFGTRPFESSLPVRAPCSKAAQETIGFLSVRRVMDAPPVMPCWLEGTALVVSTVACRIVLSSGCHPD